MDEEAEPGVEGDPGQDEVEGVLDEGEEREGYEVHEPWREEGGIRGVEGFVGGEDGEEDGGGDGQTVGDEAKHDSSSRLEALVME